MNIIEISALPNGAHRNQIGFDGDIPAGWAVIPEGMVCESFPFGDVAVDDSTPPVVTGWTPGVLPELEPESTPSPEPTVWDKLDAAYQEGVNTAYDAR